MLSASWFKCSSAAFIYRFISKYSCFPYFNCLVLFLITFVTSTCGEPSLYLPFGRFSMTAEFRALLSIDLACEATMARFEEQAPVVWGSSRSPEASLESAGELVRVKYLK
jgi:hypothetical protein